MFYHDRCGKASLANASTTVAFALLSMRNVVRISLVPLLLAATGAFAVSGCTTSSEEPEIVQSTDRVDPGADADAPSSPHGGTATPAAVPPLPPCGAAESMKCSLGRACADNQDCSSGVCQTAGPWKNTCVRAKSCNGERGANAACEGSVDCCTSITVPGGRFIGRDDAGNTSDGVVSRFALDKYEITVGRLRAFFRAMDGSPRNHPPAAGAAEHPIVPGTGWRASWNVRLPGSWNEIHERMIGECAVGGDNASWGAATWTREPGANEDKPANCIDWYTLFAFCAWDGGRLPTDAEWSYVAASGAEDRIYPWGDDAPSFATHKDVVATSFAMPGTSYGRYTEGNELRAIADGALHIASVGKKTGRSAWGHADMAGNVIEFVVDMAKPIHATCNNCVLGTEYRDPPQGTPRQPRHWQPLDENGAPPSDGDEWSDARAVHDGKRVARGGSWQGSFEGHALENAKSRHWYPVWRTYSALGGRCARSTPAP